MSAPYVPLVSDSVNRGMGTAEGMHASLYDWIVYKRGSKARERKGEEGERRSKIYTIFDHMTATVQDLSNTVRNCLLQSSVFH